MLKEITHIFIPEGPKPPYVIRLDLGELDDAHATVKLVEPLYRHSSCNEHVLWIVPAGHWFQNEERWQWSITEDGEWVVYLVYYVWWKLGGAVRQRGYSPYRGRPAV